MINSKIEWTDHTFNPWHGCMKVSEGCKNCYAETLNNRWKGSNWGPGSPRKTMSEKYWNQPLKWNAEAQAAGVPAKVFCASMGDVFEGHPDTLPHLTRLFQLIKDTPWLTWQLLTKRPENIIPLLEAATNWLTTWPDNVWIGTSVENQKAADLRIPILLRVPAKVRFLSMEPLLGPVRIDFIPAPDDDEVGASNIRPLTGRRTDMARPCQDTGKIDWVIVGGESGHGARPMHINWVRPIQKQCHAAGVPFLFKQWGEYAKSDWNNPKSIYLNKDGSIYTSQPRMMMTYGMETSSMQKVGKKEAGRLLDGREWNEMPDYLK